MQVYYLRAVLYENEVSPILSHSSPSLWMVQLANPRHRAQVVSVADLYAAEQLPCFFRHVRDKIKSQLIFWQEVSGDTKTVQQVGELIA
jgi:hypothetical protein